MRGTGQGGLERRGGEARGVAPGLRQLARSLYPDVGVLMDFSQVQHVVQGQHSRRSLGKVHCWVDMVLEE